MRISDWSSDVCSSDLAGGRTIRITAQRVAIGNADIFRPSGDPLEKLPSHGTTESLDFPPSIDRKSVVSGKSVSVRVDLGGRRSIKKKNTTIHTDMNSHNE